jgi:hypothetical protein
MADLTTIETAAQFKPTPAGKQERWSIEIDAAKKALKDWHKDGEKVLDEFLGKREGSKKRLNLFFADVTTKAATLSGVPKVRARRRFADANDDVARVSADMLERLLNTDIERDDDGFKRSLSNARADWLRPGLGQVRFRYVVEWGEPIPAQDAKTDPETGAELAPAVPEQPQKAHEDVETDYVFWRDFLWSPCRVWSEVRWVAFRAELTRDEATKRFGGEVAKRLPVKSSVKLEDKNLKDENRDAWSRVEVWEIWNKEDRTVYWFVEGHDVIVDEKPDPLELPNFLPCPEPLVANATTSKLIPMPTYFLAEDLYQEAHELTSRIRLLVKACKVAGVYDKTNTGIQKLLDDACENELIPVESWGSLVEKGGLAGAIDFLPIEPIVKAIVQLVAQRNLVKQDLYEITGQSDIMRGQAAAKATATEQRIKARFGSTRIQAEQEELARFASHAQRIRAAIICKHFDPQTIVQRSNIQQGVKEPEVIQQAIDLLKSDFAAYRVDVDGESLSMTDYDGVQQEGLAIMQATGEFFQRFGPMMAQNPVIAQFGLEMYQTMISGFRGAERFEGIIDRAIEQAKQAAAQPKPPPQDPKAEAAKVKAKADIQKTGMEMQRAQIEHGARMQEIQAEMAQDRARTQNDVVRAQAAPRAPVEQGEGF